MSTVIEAVAAKEVQKFSNPETLQGLISDPDFDILAIEEGMDAATKKSFREVQAEGVVIAQQKHVTEVKSNWVLGQTIDHMMNIIEMSTENKGRAALHCAKVLNLIEKNVTDYRRFACRFPDEEKVDQLISQGPSWTLIRYLLQYETEAEVSEALEWIAPKGQFISTTDLKRIQEGKAAAAEKGEEVSNKELAEKVAAEREEKEEAKAEARAEQAAGKKTSVSSAGSGSSNPDLVPTAKLLKKSESMAGDLLEVTTLLLTRIVRFDEIEDEKTHLKLMRTLRDKVLPDFEALKTNIEAVLEQAAEVVTDD